MNAEVIKKNWPAFQYGLNGGKVWCRDESEQEWICWDFKDLTFNYNNIFYVPDDENAEIVKAFLDGAGEIEFSYEGKEWRVLRYRKEDLLRKGLPEGYQYRIKPIRQRAAKWARYYYINEYFEVDYHTEAYDDIDDGKHNCGNYFLTKEQAGKAAEKIKQAVEEVHNEYL